MALIRETGQVQGDRVPPQSVEIEMCVLGGIMIDPRQYRPASEIIDRNTFYLESHAIVWDMFGRLHKRGIPCDQRSVLSELRGMQLTEKVGGSGVIMAMVNTVPTGANVQYHARKIQEVYQLRQLIRGCTEVIEKSYAGAMLLDDILDFAEETVLTACRRSHRISSRQIGEGIAAVIDDLTRRMQEFGPFVKGSVPQFKGLRTGMPELDDVLCGLKAGQLYIVAADPGDGKSSLALNWSYAQAYEMGLPVGWISMEMSEWTLSQRLLAQGTYRSDYLNLSVVPSTRVEKLDLTDDEYNLVLETGTQLRDIPIHVCDRQNMTIGMIKHELREQHAKYGIRAAYVDYLTLIQSMGREPRYDREVTDWCRQLRALAAELGIPIILLSQLTREKSQRNKRPHLSNLAESAGVERNADCVIFIWDEGKGVDAKTGLDQRTLIVAKNRGGPRGDQPVLWYPEATRFIPHSHFTPPLDV